MKKGKYKKCKRCGTEFYEFPYLKGKKKFCSADCANKYNADKLSKDRKGKGNPMYRAKPWNNNLSKKEQNKYKQKLIIKIKNKKVRIPWNKNKELSKKHKLKISKSRKGLYLSKTTKEKISKTQKGHIGYMLGKKHSKQTRKQMSRVHKTRMQDVNERMKSSQPLELNGNWLGGKSFEPYSIKFNKGLKEKIKKRDNYICQLCKIKEKDYFQQLSIHHIDYDKKNCGENNLITLCQSCNSKVNYNRSIWQKYFNRIIHNKYEK